MTHDALRSTQTLLPLGTLVAFLMAAMAIFGARCLALGMPRTAYIQARRASRLWKWCMEWWVWLWGPIERACTRLRVSPNAITVASALLTAGAAALIGLGHLAAGGWTYLLAASLDLVDGRVARAQGSSSPAGAFLDSTLDRVAELLVFGGLAVHFRGSPLLYAALWSAGASVLVSYARARGEALGAARQARIGGMQRAERVVLTGVPLALGPLLDAAFQPRAAELAIGSALVLLAVVTTFTAVTRARAIWRALLEGEELRSRPLANVRWLDTSRRERLGR